MGDFYISIVPELAPLFQTRQITLSGMMMGDLLIFLTLIFIVHNMIMRKRALEQTNYIVQQQLGDKHLSVSDIKEKIRNGDNSIAEKIVYFGACFRGTSQC